VIIMMYRAALTATWLVLFALMLASCATLQSDPAVAVTPAQHVAELQATIIKSGGHADAATEAAYGRALIEVGDFADASTVLDEAIDPANPNVQWLNWRGIARSESGNLIGGRMDFQESGTAAAVANLAKLPASPPVDTNGNRPLVIAPKKRLHRTGGHATAPAKAVLAPAAPFADRWPSPPIHYLERPL
jgi:hypothetical protein